MRLQFIAALSLAGLSILPFALARAEGLSRAQFQLGDVWSRRPVEAADQNNTSFRAVIISAVAINGASGTYLGKFNGHHLVATAFHVIKDPGCNHIQEVGSVYVGLELIEGTIDQCVFTSQETDFALISFKVSKDKEKSLSGRAATLDFTEVPMLHEKLIFAGRSVIDNGHQQNLMVEAGADCRVVSKTGDLRYTDDPDKLSPNGYKSWQFANSCNATPGDSGAGIFNFKTGKVIGVISTGTSPVNPEWQSSLRLAQDLAADPEIAWQMNLAVPLSKVGEIIKKQIGDKVLSVDQRKTLTGLLGAI